MPDHATTQQGSTYQADGASHTTDDATMGASREQQGAQAEYMQSLQSAAERARAALRKAGLPIDHLVPDSAKAFQQTPDGKFTLDLGSEIKTKIDNVTLVMTSKVEGVLSSGKMTDVKGVYGEKRVLFFKGKGNVTALQVKGDVLIVNTDHPDAAEIELSISALKGAG